MTDNEWLKLLLETMQEDISEIKEDVKGLQVSKFKLQGAYLAVSVIVSCLVSVLTFYFEFRN